MSAASAQLLDADLKSSFVQVGVVRGWWTLDEVDYPHVAVTFAVPTDLYAPGSLTLKLDCEGFPDIAPTGYPIDPQTSEPLHGEKRPTHGRCGMTFRHDWMGGRALYLPVDRVSFDSHPEWRSQHAHESWDPTQGLAQYLRMVRRDLTEGQHASLLQAS